MASLNTSQDEYDRHMYAMAHHPDLTPGMGQIIRKKQMLTVSDVERLAKAGVVMDYKELRHEIQPDPPKEEDPRRVTPLVDMIHTRIRMATRARDGNSIYAINYQDGHTLPEMYAVPFKDKVHVFVATGNQPPLIIEDEAQLFPSDALMAKLALLRETEKLNGQSLRTTDGAAWPVQDYSAGSPIGLDRP